jgi:murein DD-endopeptidase MepM/ murein hydrolase activator NlpD
MRPAKLPLTVTLVLVCASSASAAPRTEDAGVDAQTRTHEKWMEAAHGLQHARAELGRWLDVGPQFVGRIQHASIEFQVRLRHALAWAERWAASVAEQAVDVSVPDLTVLVAEPVKGIESSGFGWRVDPINDRAKFHKGTDYRADRGTPVYAAGPGVVVWAKRADGYGKAIYIDHGGGLVTRYAHLKTIGVDEGDVVAGDELIGEVGSTGRTTGPHLHFEVRLDGRAVDPSLAMQIGKLQRTESPAVARLAAMALVPEVQRESVDRHDPPPSRRKNRPERSGRTASRRDRPSS